MECVLRVCVDRATVDDALFDIWMDEGRDMDAEGDAYEAIIDDVMQVDCDYEDLPCGHPVRVAYEEMMAAVDTFTRAVITEVTGT